MIVYLRPKIRSAIDGVPTGNPWTYAQCDRIGYCYRFGASWINAGNANLDFGTHFVHRIKFFRLNTVNNEQNDTNNWVFVGGWDRMKWIFRSATR